MYAEVLSQLELDERYVSEQVLRMFRVAEGVEDAMRKSHSTSTPNASMSSMTGAFSLGSYPLQSGPGHSSMTEPAMTDNNTNGGIGGNSDDPTQAHTQSQTQSLLVMGRSESIGRGEGGGRGRTSSSAVPLADHSVDTSSSSISSSVELVSSSSISLLHHHQKSLDHTVTLSDIAVNVNLQKSRLAAIASAPSHAQTSHSHSHSHLSATSSTNMSPTAADSAKAKFHTDREVVTCEVMMGKCSLANEIRTLYHNLIGKKS